MNALARQNYQENKDRYLANARKREAELDYLIVKAKYKPCTDCGVQYPPYVMQFDHIGVDKVLNISAMRRKKMNFALIEAEIAKCEVVCANCHAERSHSRAPSPRLAKAVERVKGAF